ncbi:MAG: flagellar hook assembly protein FlgD [Alphaproteobacteria bacterium]
MAEISSTLNSLQAAYTQANTTETMVTQENDQSMLANDFDAFLLLLTTQMTNQDPLEPMDSSEFTNQLVMFAQAEQSVKQSGYLEDLVEANNSNQTVGATSYIGLDVIVPGNQFKLEASHIDDEGNPTQIAEEILTYYLPLNADEATLTIKDGTGKEIFTAELDGSKGEYDVSWDGTDNDGNIVDPGDYYFTVSANDTEGNAMEGITTATRGTVTNVRYDGSDTNLTLDGVRKVQLDEITGVGPAGFI